jgi:hypothetical protein
MTKQELKELEEREKREEEERRMRPNIRPLVRKSVSVPAALHSPSPTRKIERNMGFDDVELVATDESPRTKNKNEEKALFKRASVDTELFELFPVSIFIEQLVSDGNHQNLN